MAVLVKHSFCDWKENFEPDMAAEWNTKTPQASRAPMKTPSIENTTFFKMFSADYTEKSKGQLYLRDQPVLGYLQNNGAWVDAYFEVQ